MPNARKACKCIAPWRVIPVRIQQPIPSPTLCIENYNREKHEASWKIFLCNKNIQQFAFDFTRIIFSNSWYRKENYLYAYLCTHSTPEPFHRTKPRNARWYLKAILIIRQQGCIDLRKMPWVQGWRKTELLSTILWLWKYIIRSSDPL